MIGIRLCHPHVQVAYIIETYLAFSVGAFWKGLANNGMTPEQRKNLDPSSEEYRLRYGKYGISVPARVSTQGS
jgi:hypothetical protein